MSSSSALSLLSACLLCSSYMLAAESGRSPSSARALSLPPLSPSTIFLLSFSGNGIFASRLAISLTSLLSRFLMFSLTACLSSSCEYMRSRFAPSTCCTTSSRFSCSRSTLATTDLSFCSCSSANRLCRSRPVITSSNSPVSISLSSSSSTSFGARSMHATDTDSASRKGSNQTMAEKSSSLGLYGRLNVTADGNVSSAAAPLG
jgi:hypothetical protein